MGLEATYGSERVAVGVVRVVVLFFFFQAEDGIRDLTVTGVQTCALPISVALFSYVGLPGSVTRGRIYGLVNLYLLLGMFYFAVFNFIETVEPGSFRETALPALDGISRHSLLYLSLVTLTTLGYGDVVAISRPARIVAALE